MSLLATAADLSDRQAVAAESLAPLARSLRSELDTLLSGEVMIPSDKALLSRDGGRCAADGAVLEFDPYSPQDHRCPVCGSIFRGERHDRWWITWYQLWLAERAVHASLLHALSGEEKLAQLASSILHGYAKAYQGYPNVDNVLGPSRPFFSTYLESIWLLQLCVATDILETAGAPGFRGDRVRDGLIEPSVSLIASFDEGASNRQVWNNASLIAANLLLDRPSRAERAVSGRSGLISHLESGLLTDGTWYEGENYHFFAHRGLWYGVTMAELADIGIDKDLARRFEEAFAAPLSTVLPDFTFPARRDSQYGVSLRQWRFAESFELGLARREDHRLAGALWTLYETPADPGDTGRWRSTAEAERNEPPRALSRADLGWRSLIFAKAQLPRLENVGQQSALLGGQGLAVFRRNAAHVYAALDYGHPGGGHGHPDRLNLLIMNGNERWLDDMGTGSYVDESLHWYRSTLAHNAPLVDGKSQHRVSGVLLAHDEQGGVGWVWAEVPRAGGGIAAGVDVSRSVVVMPDYLVDEVTWDCDHHVVFDLPIHVDGAVFGLPEWKPALLRGGEAAEDGFSYVRDSVSAQANAGQVVRLEIPGAQLGRAWFRSRQNAEWWKTRAPGPPGSDERPFLLVRCQGGNGCISTVWGWSGAVRSVEWTAATVIVALMDGTRHEHGRTAVGWHVDLVAGSSRSSIDLSGMRPRENVFHEPSTPRVPAPLRIPLTIDLGAAAYRRSEATWEEAGSPRARVSLRAEGSLLVIGVDVEKSPVIFRRIEGADPALDNEHPDIHSDGVQLYLAARGWSEFAAWLAIPVPESNEVRIRTVAGTLKGVSLDASWNSTASGYQMSFRVPLSTMAHGNDGPFEFGLDVIVNDMGPGRQRRRGQLVLSGGAGEYVYLRGDRQPRFRFLNFVVSRD